MTNFTITRAILADRLHQRIGFSKSLCHHVVRDCLTHITDALTHNEPVKIHGFGSFAVYHKAPRMARHFGTSKEIYVPAKRTVTFTASPQLKQKVRHSP